MFSLSSSGSSRRTEAYLRRLMGLNIAQILDANGQLGVDALSEATPIESGLASDSWSFRITDSDSSCTISWHNVDVETGFPVAIMLQFGYATGTGGYVKGRDYINPAMKPVFDKIQENVWKAVTSAR